MKTAFSSSINRSVVGVLLILLPACDSGSDAAEKKVVSPHAASASGGQEQPKDIPQAEQSRFLAEIDKDKYAEDKTRNQALLIRFDFSGKRVYAFDFSQQVENATSMSDMPEAARGRKQKMDAKGAMVLKSKGDKSGTLVIKDLKASMVMAGKPGEPERSREMQMPVMAIPDVKEDGTMDGGAANAQPLLKMLFPMTTNLLKPGESAESPVSMPFNAMGSPLTVKGTMKTSHKGYFTVDGKPCARLETEIDISRLDVPKEVEGKYSCSVRGRSIYYFDVEAQEFASGQTAMLMKVSMDGKKPAFNAPPKEKPEDPPKSFQMAMESDNLIRFIRNPALAKKEAEEK